MIAILQFKKIHVGKSLVLTDDTLQSYEVSKDSQYLYHTFTRGARLAHVIMRNTAPKPERSVLRMLISAKS